MSQIRIAAINATHFDRRMKWNRSCVNQLCALKKITHAELAAYIGWNAPAFKRYYNTNRFPDYITLLLETFEAVAKKKELGESPDFDLPFPH
jgi:hypothetical protein